MAFKYKLKEEPFNVGDIKTKGGVKTTVRDIDPETGTVSWKVEYVPAFDSTFKEFQELRQYLKRLAQKTDDNVIDNLSDDVNKLFNQYRTHLRKKYPDEYKKMTMNESEIGDIDLANVTKLKYNNAITSTKDFAAAILDVWNELSNKENDAITSTNYMKQAKAFLQKAMGVEEMSTSGGAGAYLTPYAFKLPKKKKKVNEEIDLVHVYRDGEMFGTGELVKVLPNGKVRVRFDGSSEGTFDAKNVKPVKEAKIQENNNPGASLGPGPKAGPDGVKDNYYVKAFKYKLVPSKIKGSGLEVKKLF